MNRGDQLKFINTNGCVYIVLRKLWSTRPYQYPTIVQCLILLIISVVSIVKDPDETIQITKTFSKTKFQILVLILVHQIHSIVQIHSETQILIKILEILCQLLPRNIQTNFATNSQGLLLGTSVVGSYYPIRALIDLESEAKIQKVPSHSCSAQFSGLNNGVSASCNKVCS